MHKRTRADVAGLNVHMYIHVVTFEWRHKRFRCRMHESAHGILILKYEPAHRAVLPEFSLNRTHSVSKYQDVKI